MKKLMPGAFGLLLGLVLSASVQAAPITYQFNPWIHFEFHSLANGSSTMISTYVLTAENPLSIGFTYDPGVAVTPIDLMPSSPTIVYVETFDIAGAFTGVAGSLGAQRFVVDNLSSRSFAFIDKSLYPGDIVSRKVGAVGEWASDGPDFQVVYNGHNFTLDLVSLTFFGGPNAGALPLQLDTAISLDTQVQLKFNGDDGTTLTANYIGSLTAVPVPSAFWLFGSALLAPVTLRLRKRK